MSCQYLRRGDADATWCSLNGPTVLTDDHQVCDEQLKALRAERDALQAELLVLRTALVKLADATGEHIIGDEPWRAAFKALLALIPDDCWGLGVEE